MVGCLRSFHSNGLQQYVHQVQEGTLLHVLLAHPSDCLSSPWACLLITENY